MTRPHANHRPATRITASLLLALMCGPLATGHAFAGSEGICFQISRMALEMARDRDDGVSYTSEQAKFESNLKTIQPDWRRAFRGLYMGALDLVYKHQRDAKPDELQRAVYKVCVSEY
ncbi:hypothetical protein [Burkholderia pseudomallei]|uniref:hypothetical protein n=1 Tax=Burkholderia pseudomallei TaxID=28450 RepID=UPI0012B4259B|nr:hypothetical protein [Burkholderia pseudomallei]BEH31527.1 hypothetical protein GTC054_27430 [Burkholderia pseudomallei]